MREVFGEYTQAIIRDRKPDKVITNAAGLNDYFSVFINSFKCIKQNRDTGLFNLLGTAFYEILLCRKVSLKFNPCDFHLMGHQRMDIA